jgi:hypothetical protein
MSYHDVRIPNRPHLYTFAFFSSVCIPHIPSISSVYTHYRVTHMSLYPPPRPAAHMLHAHSDLIPLYTTTILNFYSATPHLHHTDADIHHTYIDIQHQHTPPFLTTIPKSVSRRRRPLRLFGFEIPVCSGRHGRAFVLFIFRYHFGHCTLLYLDTLRGPTLCLLALHNFSFVQNTVVLL